MARPALQRPLTAATESGQKRATRGEQGAQQTDGPSDTVSSRNAGTVVTWLGHMRGLESSEGGVLILLVLWIRMCTISEQLKREPFQGHLAAKASSCCDLFRGPTFRFVGFLLFVFSTMVFLLPPYHLLWV